MGLQCCGPNLGPKGAKHMKTSTPYMFDSAVPKIWFQLWADSYGKDESYLVKQLPIFVWG
jgi:hypothetical protein